MQINRLELEKCVLTFIKNFAIITSFEFETLFKFMVKKWLKEESWIEQK